MSIQDEINRINQNIANTYSALGDMGATLPSKQNSENMANAVRTIPQGNAGSSSSFKVTATANLTSETGGILTDISHSYTDIEAASNSGKCVNIDVDIGQMSEGQRVTLCLVSYIEGAALMFGGTFYTGEVCMQMSCILTADGYSVIYVNPLPTMEDLSGLGSGGNSFLVTAYGAVSMGSNGISISVSNVSHTYAEILTAYNAGKNISFVADTNTGSKMSFCLSSVDASSINFSCAAHAGADFLMIGIGINSDGTITVFNKMI